MGKRESLEIRKDMEPIVWESQKEKWKNQLQEVDRKRTELLPDHQKMQKRSQKLQSLQDKKRNHAHVLVTKKCGSVSRLCLKSLAIVGGQVIWKTKSRSWRQERKEEAAVRRQSNGCLCSATVEHIFACGAAHSEHFIEAMQEEFNRRFKAPARSGANGRRRSETRLGRRLG